jgi:hypothetical protein
MKSNALVAFLGGWSTYPVDGRRHSIERGDGCASRGLMMGWNGWLMGGFWFMIQSIRRKAGACILLLDLIYFMGDHCLCGDALKTTKKDDEIKIDYRPDPAV